MATLNSTRPEVKLVSVAWSRSIYTVTVSLPHPPALPWWDTSPLHVYQHQPYNVTDKKLYTWTGLLKAGLRWPRISLKFEFRYDSLKSKFSWILFVYNLVTGYSKKNGENYPLKYFWKKKPGLKSNHGLVLISLWATGPWVKKVKAEESFSVGVVFTAGWAPHAWGKRNCYSFISLFGVCENQHREQIRSQREAITLFTLDMIANTAESVMRVVSIPCWAKLLARSWP